MRSIAVNQEFEDRLEKMKNHIAVTWFERNVLPNEIEWDRILRTLLGVEKMSFVEMWNYLLWIVESMDNGQIQTINNNRRITPKMLDSFLTSFRQYTKAERLAKNPEQECMQVKSHIGRTDEEKKASREMWIARPGGPNNRMPCPYCRSKEYKAEQERLWAGLPSGEEVIKELVAEVIPFTGKEEE